ncbi:2-oxoglutarate-Fe(II) type oxidoreductase hxnY-like isoform X2 [Rhodamnia argentea]|uniref:2-oxoglutarate-Fe(II) type oxidoreductase hxnY-like isoform X2 n=1 Tax=Rhodamnia argentea TaxID=178133 RepID=A0ABM3H9H0_9MYRT|nr:2-oxoglutarate-Fe(II) type oxidoreductase hxnY-like isoform X2 [Rhodamnia argentea]
MNDANAIEVAGVPTSALNCIDLSSSDIQQSVSLLKQACLDSGFFYVINHGVGQDLMEEVFVQSRRFFGLPLSEKMKLLRNEKHRGYTPLFDEVLDPGNQIQGDYKEGYYIGEEIPEDDLDAQKPHFGPNLWPSEDILPRWRQTMEKFHSQALNMAKVVARIIALALDLEADFFDKPEILGKPIPILRLLHYEGWISDPSKGIYGAGAHSDFGLITLLATDDVLGLQICKNKDAKPQAWEYVQPLKGSTLHRVIGNGQERYSIAFFLDPNHDCLIECLPTCMSEENPPKFPPILCQTYLAQRYYNTHADLDVYRREGA